MTYRQAIQKVYERLFALDDEIKEMNKQLTSNLLDEVQKYIASEITNLGYKEVEGLKVYYASFTANEVTRMNFTRYKLFESLYTKLHVGISLTKLDGFSKIKQSEYVSNGVLHIGDMLDGEYGLNFEAKYKWLFTIFTDNTIMEFEDIINTSDRNTIKIIIKKIIKKGFKSCPALNYLKTLLVKKWRMIINQIKMIQEMLDLLEGQVKDNLAIQMRNMYIHPDRIESMLTIITLYFSIFGNELEGYIVNYPQAGDIEYYKTIDIFRLCEIRDVRLLIAYNLKDNTYAKRDLDTFLDEALDEEIDMEGLNSAIKRIYSTEVKGDQSSAAIYRFLFGKEIPFNVRTGASLE